MEEPIRRLRGDLDGIVPKALEKDRTRRYDTANGLAMVDRLLAPRGPSLLEDHESSGRSEVGVVRNQQDRIRLRGQDPNRGGNRDEIVKRRGGQR